VSDVVVGQRFVPPNRFAYAVVESVSDSGRVFYRLEGSYGTGAYGICDKKDVRTPESLGMKK